MLLKIFGNDSKQSLRVTIHTPYRGPGDLPAIYVTPDEPGKIHGFVEFESTEDIKGEDLDLVFRVKSEARWARHYGQVTVVFHSKQVLQRKSWDIPIQHSQTGVVSAGTTRFDFEAVLDDPTPSSIKGRRSWLNYRFTATLHRRFPRRNIVFRQDVWAFSTCLPDPSSGYMPVPHTQAGIWESHLPYTCSLPSQDIPLGQTIPLTIRLDPFLPSSGHFGQELVVVSAMVKLKQFTRLWHKWDVKANTDVVLALPVDNDWERSANGIQRTILVDIPPAPELSCTTRTRPVRKTHAIKLTMRVKTSTMTDKEARKLRIEIQVNITGPRPPTDAPQEGLPPYSASWDGHDDGDNSD